MRKSARSVALIAVAVGVLALPSVATAGKDRPPGAFDSFTFSKNMKPLGFSERTVPFDSLALNSDLAFWGDYAFQGSYEGFRIVDIDDPDRPRQIMEFDDCVEGTTTGNQGDVIVWDDILVRSWNSPAPAGGAMCGDLFTPEGQEGLHIFDISDPRDPEGLAFVPVTGGSHTATAVPDRRNDRLLVYNSASSEARQGIDIVEIPLDDPEDASVLSFEPAGRPCHDTAVILGDVMRAACAGHDGFTVWSLDRDDRGSLDNPRFLYQRSVEGVQVGHSASFSWDGDVLVFGHEPGGGVQARCQASNPEVERTLFFFDTETGVERGRWVLPRTQTATENCTIHNYNVVPTSRRDVLVSGNYQSGIAVVDFTDPSRPREIAFADPAPLSTTELVIGGDWSSYWYNGEIYESDIRRGLLTWELRSDSVKGAKKLSHLNPQTQEFSFDGEDRDRRSLTGRLRQVGHEPLRNRGMNAAIAIHEDFAYIGSRTDGSHPNAGVMVVDIDNPRRPRVVREMMPPLEGNIGESSRELRVWESQEILIVLHTNCGGPTAHGCVPPSINNFRFYDISGRNASNPQLIHQMDMSTHEFYLWVDPRNPDRALMYGGSAGNNLTVWDISPVADGQAPVVLRTGGHGYTRFPPSPAPVEIPTGGLHSLSVSNDGTRAYYALLDGGFAVVDTSDFALGVPNPQLRLITENSLRPHWAGPGAHSAVKFWNRDWAYVSDEVYGTATGSDHGCPWGWARMIDISNPVAPTVESEYQLPQNYEFLCDEFEPRPRTSYSAHNPTLTPNIALSTWHSGGFQAISIEDPLYPYKLADFYPRPLPQVGLEDPRLSSDPDTGENEKVVMWSYPIVKDGLIYVVDLRNGLYVLEYDGRFEDEVEDTDFLEGNSNQGDALCFEPPAGASPRGCGRRDRDD
jgi:hypothetical protein